MSGLFSRNVAALTPSATLAVSREAKRLRKEGVNVVDLGAGEPDFGTPKLVAEAGIKATQRGETHYTATEGIMELRAAIARRLSLLAGGRMVNADNIIVSNGCKQSIFNACLCLFGANDKVLIPTPAWTSYPQIVHLSHATPVEVPGDPEWSLKVPVEDLDRWTDDAVKGLILNSPSNPTGAVYTAAELKAILEWAKRKGVWVLADEIYRQIHYGVGPAPSVLDFPDDLLERVVLLDGASKAFAMTGWRIGFALAPRELDTLRLIARGMSNNEIANELGVHPRTVAKYVSGILRKLQLRGTYFFNFYPKAIDMLNLIRRTGHEFGISVIETMGLTETAAPAFSNPPERARRKYGSPGVAFGNDRFLAAQMADQRGERSQVRQ